jgi:hypothetical protein
MKHPKGKQIGEEIITDYFPKLIEKKTSTPKLKSLLPFLTELTDIIPKSVVKNGIPAQLEWIYVVYQKGTAADNRVNWPHEHVIARMATLFDSFNKKDFQKIWPLRDFKRAVILKKRRANRKGGKARAEKAKKNIENSKNFFEIGYNSQGVAGSSWSDF